LALKFVAARGGLGQKFRPGLRRQVLHGRGCLLVRFGRRFFFRFGRRLFHWFSRRFYLRQGGFHRRQVVALHRLGGGRCSAAGLRGAGSQQEQGKEQRNDSLHMLPSSDARYYSEILLWQHRTIWQEHSAKDFASYESYKRAGILYVFPPFITAR